MQSIENLLSPVGQAVEHNFAFESKTNGSATNCHLAGMRAPSIEVDVPNGKSVSERAGTAVAVGKPTGANNHYRLDEEMVEYDVDPLPLNMVVNNDVASTTKQVINLSEKGTRSRGIVIEEKPNWQKKDVVAKGLYKPWFFSRFAKSRIPLGKPQCIADLKNINNSYRNLKVGKYGDESDMDVKSRKSRGHDEDGERTTRRKRDTEQDDFEDEDEDEDEEAPEELWVECERCNKWRKVPPGVEIDADKSFFCQMLPAVTCETPEENWDEEETEWVEGEDTPARNNQSTSPHNAEANGGSNGTKRGGGGYGNGHGGKKRKAPGSEKAAGKGGRRRGSPNSASSEEPLSPEDITAASSLYGGGGGGGGQGMSRLAAVVRVLRATGRALHYDVLTKQALRLGLIRFTGSQGTAGESMKAFLNKTIRENKTAAVVNLGKGVYGLKEWQSPTGHDNLNACPPGPGPTSLSAQAEPLHSELCREGGSLSPPHDVKRARREGDSGKHVGDPGPSLAVSAAGPRVVVQN